MRESGYSTASPNNILTWMQLRRPKKPQNVLLVTKEVYQEIKTVLEYKDDIVTKPVDGKQFSIYKASDRKILYMILQHSLYSRRNKLYLLCTCLRGDEVRDSNH